MGSHFIAELVGCDPRKIGTVDAVRPILTRAVEDCGATALRYAWHQFDPAGMSATVLLEESHFCVHSWPERAYMAVDVFTCGEKMDPEMAIRTLAEAFGADRTVVTVIARGVPA